MKFNFKSFVRAALQVGGAVAASGVVHGPGIDVLTQILGYVGVISGVVWGQVNAAQQTQLQVENTWNQLK